MLEAIILGIVQGLTEFLPVSSSGHLEIAKFILQDDRVAEQSMLMTVVLHFATALSTCFVFRQDIIEIIQGLLKLKWNEQFDFAGKIVLSMIPAAIVGLAFEDQIEMLFDKRLLLVGMMLVITAILLLLADRAKRTEKKVGWFDALVVGIAQAIAILPGISRSGATISTSVLLGIDRERAARFSFLMVVPLIFGKIAKDILDAIKGDDVEAAANAAVEPLTTVANSVGLASNDYLALAAGFVAAFVTGLFACTWMIALVKKARLSFFSYYCFIVAMLAIFWAWRLS